MSSTRKFFEIAGLTALVASLVLSLPAQAAKADKPEKPDKPEREKPDKIERVLERGERAERMPKAERSRSDRGNGAASSDATRASAAASASSTVARVPVSSGGAEFEPFRIIVDRNIFNPSRTGRARVTEEGPQVKVEQFALVGTMESEKGRVAFFDGGDAAYRKVARVGDSFAGFTVKDISANSVELAAGDKSLPLQVNQQARRAEGGEWRVSAREPVRVEAGTGTPSAAVAPTVPANASEALRRLMEQRQKQLKQ